VTPVGNAVGHVAGWLAEVYALDLGIRAEEHVLEMSPEAARQLLPAGCRSGVLLVEEEGELHLGLHLAPEDRENEGTLVEETSHLVCLAWHGGRDLPVSQLILELQADVDRFVFARLLHLRSHRDALTHFERFRFAPDLTRVARDRYELAHEKARAYCRGLCARFPRRRDTPAMLAELRRFYRASPEQKLRAA
jgi:hypothetical protein